jgi:hypothetical protein
VAAHDDRAVGERRDGERPLVGGVGFGAVGVQARQVVLHDPGQLLDGALGCDGGEGPVELRQVDSLRERRRPPGLLRHRGDDRDLFCRDGTAREGGLESGQMV